VGGGPDDVCPPGSECRGGSDPVAPLPGLPPPIQVPEDPVAGTTMPEGKDHVRVVAGRTRRQLTAGAGSENKEMHEADTVAAASIHPPGSPSPMGEA
jgi:hypothetical protein